MRGSPVIRALAFVLLLLAAAAQAQTYPTRPVTIIVPFAPGGISDITARPLAAALGKIMGQSFIIENRPGAGGAIGAAHAAKQRPDGYSLMMALTSLMVIPEAEKVAGRQPSYLISQFAPIARVAADPAVLLVRSESPWKTTADLVADARNRSGRISYSSSGLYGAIHVPMEMLAQSAGMQMIHVPYKSGGEAMTALLAGQVDVTVQAPGVASPHVKSGKVRVLGSWGTQRTKALPEVPTLKEQGHDVEFYIWSALFAPAETPSDIVVKLRSAVKEAINEPLFTKAMAGMDAPIEYLDAPDLQSNMDREGKRLADTVQRMGKIE